jgi:hypothetical protein
MYGTGTRAGIGTYCKITVPVLVVTVKKIKRFGRFWFWFWFRLWLRNTGHDTGI